MIEIKVDEEQKEESPQIEPKLNPDAYYLREISRTMKEILKEMKKRKN